MAAIFLWRHFHKTDVTVKKPTVSISSNNKKPSTLPGDSGNSSSTSTNSGSVGSNSTSSSASSASSTPTGGTSATGSTANANTGTTASASNANLTATGPEDTLWVFAGATVVGTVGYQVVMRRRQSA
ncbi:hypothetical protein KC976_02025 [Candidatus Saccharibacteria bacterium]|nr:hypothetical protein [Candidatus Saccharibacteria bacterium]